MKTLVTTLAVCFLAAGVSARQDPAPQAQTKTPPEIILTGCLVQGSGPTVFVVENAQKDPKSTTETAVKYVLVAGTEDLNLRTHVNHEVRLNGVTDGKIAPPTTQKIDEKDLPRFTVRGITMVSDTCTTFAR